VEQHMYSEKNTRLNYISNQLITVSPFPVGDEQNGQFKIKLHSERGESKWLNITPQQFKQLEAVLLEEIIELRTESDKFFESV